MLSGGRYLRLVATALIILMLCGTAVFSDDLKTTLDISTIGMGARPIGLGGAYAGLADDASAIFINPAGLGLQNRISFVSMSTQVMTFVDYQVAGLVYPTEWGVFGVGYIGATSPAGNYTYMSGTTTVEEGSISYANQLFIFSYGYDLTDQMGGELYAFEGQTARLSLGADIKYLSQGFSGALRDAPNASGFDADLGVMYSPASYLTFGAVMQNMYRGKEGESITWTTDEKETLPTTYKLGVSYLVLDNVTLLLDSDIPARNEQKIAFHAGTEWRVMPMLTLRIGADQREESVTDTNPETQLVARYTLGVGLSFAGFRFDYAYKQDPVFNELSTNYFSLCYIGNPFEKAKKVEESPLSTDYEKLMNKSE